MYTLIDGVQFYDKDEIDDLFAQNGHTGLSDRINQEATDRAAADAALGARIDQEIVDRIDGDDAIADRLAQESNIRLLGDQTLANQLTALEQLWSTLIAANFIDTDNNNIISDDSGKSVRQIAHDEFYRQLVTDADNVKQQLDTLKELADYLQNNPTILTDIYTKLGVTWSLDTPTDFGVFDFSTVLNATDIDSAIVELYNVFNNKIGDLTQLTTTFKTNIVGAINELDEVIKTKKYQDLINVVFTVDPTPNILPDETHIYTCDGSSLAFDEVKNYVGENRSLIGVVDLGQYSKYYCTLQSATDTDFRFSGNGVYINTSTADGVTYTFWDMTIEWSQGGNISVSIKRDHFTKLLETTVQRIDATIGDINDLDVAMVNRSNIVAALNSEFEWRRKNDEAESKAREAADNALGARIDQEITDRTDGDDALKQRLDALPKLQLGAFSMAGLGNGTGNYSVRWFLDRCYRLCREQMGITNDDGNCVFGIVSNNAKGWEVTSADGSSVRIDSGTVLFTWTKDYEGRDLVYMSTKTRQIAIMSGNNTDNTDGTLHVYSLDAMANTANDAVILDIGAPTGLPYTGAVDATALLNKLTAGECPIVLIKTGEDVIATPVLQTNNLTDVSANDVDIIVPIYTVIDRAYITSSIVKLSVPRDAPETATFELTSESLNLAALAPRGHTAVLKPTGDINAGPITDQYADYQLISRALDNDEPLEIRFKMPDGAAIGPMSYIFVKGDGTTGPNGADTMLMEHTSSMATFGVTMQLSGDHAGTYVISRRNP